MNNRVARVEDAAARHPLRELLGPVLDYKWHILVFCISTILFSLTLTYMYADKYMAATTIQFRPQEVTRLRQKESLAFGAPLPTPPFDVIYDNLQLLVKSEPILLEVVDELNLDAEEEKVYDGPPWVQLFKRTKDKLKQLRDDTWTLLKYGRMVSDDPATAALKGLRKHLSLINHNSYVFYLSFIDKKPQRAALIVDMIAGKVVESLLEDQRMPGVLRLRQLKTLREAKEAEIETYQDQIEQLLTSHGIASVELETDRTMNRYSELRLDLVRLESEIAMVRARRGALDSAAGAGRERGQSLLPEDYRRLKSERVSTEIELQALLEEHRTLDAAVGQLERKIGQLPRIQHAYDSLQQSLRSAQRVLLQIVDPYHEAQVQATDNLSEAVVAHKARVPSTPISPIKVYHVGLAGGLSLCIAFGMAYLLAFARSTQVSELVGRTVSSVVGMWDGVERRRQQDRRRGESRAYDGTDRRRSGDRRNDESAA